MNESINPYASPRELPERNESSARRTLVGTFTVDEATQRDAARGYRIRHVIWLVATVLPLILLLPLPFLTWRGDAEWLLTAMIVIFVVGSCATVGLHVAIDWSIFWHNLRQLQQHPVLGALGPWRVTIDEEEIQVTTGRGAGRWPLNQVRRMELSSRPVVLWLERDLAIALPKHGDYGEDDYTAVKQVLRQRVRHIGQPG